MYYMATPMCTLYITLQLEMWKTSMQYKHPMHGLFNYKKPMHRMFVLKKRLFSLQEDRLSAVIFVAVHFQTKNVHNNG